MSKIEIALLVLTVVGPIAAYFAAKSKNKVDDALVPPVLDAVKTELEKHKEPDHKA